METQHKTIISKDFDAKTICISREFNAPLALVWRAYTEKDLLEKWWAPKPWRAETKTMNFTIGGYWLYAMVSPENEKHWGRMNYIAIDLHKSFQIEDFFCDDEGEVTATLPTSKGSMSFNTTTNGTLVEFKMTYATEADLLAIVEMGFEQGITMCLDQLNVLLENGI